MPGNFGDEPQAIETARTSSSAYPAANSMMLTASRTPRCRSWEPVVEVAGGRAIKQAQLLATHIGSFEPVASRLAL